MKKLTLGVLVSSMAFSASALANETYYGASLESLTFSSSGFKDHHALAGSFAAGLKINQNFALEGRLGIGLTEGTQTEYDEIQLFGNPYKRKIETKLKLQNYFGVYAVGLIPINENFTGHIKAGFANVSLKATAITSLPELDLSESESTSRSESGFSYRFGASYKINPTMSAIAEYGSLPSPDSSELTQFTVGLNINF